MTRDEAATLRSAISDQHVVTLLYHAPLRGGVVTRHVRPYEISVNRAGLPTLWGTDSIHGPRRIHAFRLDRIVSVSAPEGRKTYFEKAISITKHLIYEGADDDD